MWIFSHVRMYELEWVIEIWKFRSLEIRSCGARTSRPTEAGQEFSPSQGRKVIQYIGSKVFVTIAVKKEKSPGATTFHRRLKFSLSDRLIVLGQFLRHQTAPTLVYHYDFHRSPIKNADVSSTVPPSRRVRPRAADRLRDSSSEFFEKTTKKIFHLGVKKNWFASSKTGSINTLSLF